MNHPTMIPAFDTAIIGAGVIGLAICREILKRDPARKVLIIDKESHEAFHASGRNSGVLHAGFYYKAGSLKARFCVRGNRALREYCLERGLRINECGKLVVATVPAHVQQLNELHKRGLENGAEVSLITEAEAAKIDPNARTIDKALFSPRTATVNPKDVCAALLSECRSRGATVRFEHAFRSYAGNTLTTSREPFRAAQLINCAGLYADAIAHSQGVGRRYTVVPFKGLYLKYSGSSDAIRTNIYPVPDLRLPFLGVHFTKTVDGQIKIGPTAIPAFWRESYQGFSRFRPHEVPAILWQELKLFLSNRSGFRTLALEEIRKYWKPYLVRLAQQLVHQIDTSGFREYTAPGIRAQLVDRVSGELVQDFLIEGSRENLHILNAVSPGLTCCFPFAEYLCENYQL